MAQSANKFIIRSFDPESHEVMVYFRDFRTVTPIIIKLPVIDGLHPEGQDLENYILSFMPVIEEKKPVEIAKNADYILGLVKETTRLPSKVSEAKAAAIAKRSTLLYQSDWTQLPDVQHTLDDEEKLRWGQYRQDLRDITKQSGWPTDISWPKMPFLFEVTIYE
jgi:hypothetical protein